MQFKSKTLEAINNSIENPNYQTNPQNSQVQDQLELAKFVERHQAAFYP